MATWKQLSIVSLAFVLGGLFFSNVQFKPLRAQTSGLSGSFYCMGTSPSFGFKTTVGAKFDAIFLGIINFDTKMDGPLITAMATVTNSDPSYSIETSTAVSFTVSDGPIVGTYKVNYSSTDYLVVAPVNSGNTLFLFDPQGATAICQKS